MTKDAKGNETALGREKFYVPASVLHVRVDPAQPLAWGIGSEVEVMFSASPTFRLSDLATKSGLERVAWFDSKTPLRSGWAWGQENLMGGVAIAEAKVGKGKLALFGPQILYRGQPHGTFKFLFNGIVQAGGREVKVVAIDRCGSKASHSPGLWPGRFGKDRGTRPKAGAM